MSIYASNFNELKSLIKAEFARRSGNGSLVPYTSSNYDFNNIPTTNGPILLEHGEKTINLLLDVVNVDNFSKVQTGSIVKSLDTLYTKVNDMKSKPMTSSSSDCKSLCSGLCISTCTTSCVGSCAGSCTGGCVGGCTDICTGDCLSNCSICSNSCTGGCDGCDDTCEGFCTGNCAYSCGDACSGCSSGCGSSCDERCGANCVGQGQW